MRVKHHNDGLQKRCGCPRRQWSKCSHPWHFGFHHGGKEYRFSLHKLAKKPLGYFMSKSEAEALQDKYRGQIREGCFVDPNAPEQPKPIETRLTFGDLCDRYMERYVRVPTRRERAIKMYQWHIGMLKRAEVKRGNSRIPLEKVPIVDITKGDIELIRDARRSDYRERLERTDEQGMPVNTPFEKGGEVGTNRLLSRLRQMFNWAIEQDCIERTPFRKGDRAVIKLESSVEVPRSRRLEPGEEERLLKGAGDHLRDLITAALETGCRKGELLSLQFRQIKWDRNLIELPAARTKTNEARVVPISSRLRAILEMRRHGPDGEELGPDAYVFGNEVGEPIKSIKTAWKLTCKRTKITDLHFHDLRREFACRLLETPGVDLHIVRDWIGHTNINTTNHYLSTTATVLQNALEKFEEARKIRTSFAQKLVSDAAASGQSVRPN